MNAESPNMTNITNMNHAHIGGNEMIFSINEGGACSGGFNVKSIMMKAGMPPITTIPSQTGGDNVSDLFGGGNLVIPSWLLSYTTMTGGKYTSRDGDDDDDDNDIDGGGCVSDNLYESLLELVRKPVDELTRPKKSSTKKNKKNVTRNNKSNTKRQKV